MTPSLLSADFSRLGGEVQKLQAAGADGLHIDVMDGHFVPNLTVGIPVLKSLKKITSLPLEVHLMIHRPERMVEAFISAGADVLFFHHEATLSSEKLLHRLKGHSVKTGVALKPETPVQRIFPLLRILDRVLVMTVSPGFGGQKLLRDQVEKITLVKKEMARAGLNLPVGVDGGVTDQTLPLLKEADILVSGSFVFRTPNYKQAIRTLQAGAEQVS